MLEKFKISEILVRLERHELSTTVSFVKESVLIDVPNSK